MLLLKPYLRMASALLLPMISISIASCAQTSSNGAGYQYTHFADPKVAIAVSQDEKAGPAVDSNNKQCKKDRACLK